MITVSKFTKIEHNKIFYTKQTFPHPEYLVENIRNTESAEYIIRQPIGQACTVPIKTIAN